MTLIVAAGNPQYVAVVSDRRLTGRLEDESNKATILRSPGIRAVAVYTGLAESGDFKTATWLPEALHAAMRKGSLDLDEFCASANERFGRLRAGRRHDLCLALGIFGFVVATDETVPRLTRVFISNCRDGGGPGEFRSLIEQASGPDDFGASFALVGGSHHPSYEPRRKAIEQMAEQNRPARAIVAKAVELIQAASKIDSKVGAQCSSVVVTRQGSGTFNYHSGVPTQRIYTPAIVTPTDTFLGAYIERMSPGVAAVPKVASGRPCPCRSGRAYGKCHGRTPARGVQPKVVFTPEGKIRMSIGPHQLPSDRDALVFELRENELPRTRPRRRKP